MRIAGKHVKGQREGVEFPADGDVLMYDETADMWLTVAVNDLPVSVVGITATTIGTALAELLAAIGP